MDAYVRVSRRAGREGESFISPEVQRKKIAAWAEMQGVEVLEWWEEIDQSGAKLERPLFQQALERCERGRAEGSSLPGSIGSPARRWTRWSRSSG